MYYRQYKGGIYKLLHITQSLNDTIIKTISDLVATHTETGEEIHVWIHNKAAYTSNGEFAIYHDIKGKKIWARPKKMFFENIEFNGEKIRRFEPIGNNIEGFKKEYLCEWVDSEDESI